MSDDRFHAGIDIRSGSGPVYRVRLPKHPKPPVPDRWSAAPPTGCDLCDFIGPLVPAGRSDLREAHRSLHQFSRLLTDAVVRGLARIMR